MRILFWIPYPTEGASNRYRIEQYLPFLKSKGIEFSVRPFWSESAFKILYKKGDFLKKVYFFSAGTFSRLIDIFLIHKYDIVFIHREAYPLLGPFLETILFKLNVPLVFDFDDAIFLPARSVSNNFIKIFKNPGKTTKIIQMSRYVIVGNNYLADFALKFNKNICVIPTPIDTDKYFSTANHSPDEITIGWIGSASTQNFINIVKDVFIKLFAHFKNIRFKVIGGDFFIPGLPNIISKPWLLSTEIDDLKTFDIGIMPMPNDEWTKGKCGFKAILCMSMGIPCVCSSVGMNKEIIIDGVNGFLAETEEDWFNKISLLIEDYDLRKKIGAAGRRTIEENYSLKVNRPKFLGVINTVYKESRLK